MVSQSGTLIGRRVRLRPAEVGDAQIVDGLRAGLPGGDCSSADCMVIELVGEEEAVGFIDYADGSPGEGWATFGAMAVREGRRGWGYGSEAVRVLESHLSETSKAKRFRAAVSKELGLALYFWLRQGYQPAEPEEQGAWQGGGCADMIWMVGGENLELRT